MLTLWGSACTRTLKVANPWNMVNEVGPSLALSERRAQVWGQARVFYSIVHNDSSEYNLKRRKSTQSPKPLANQESAISANTLSNVCESMHVSPKIGWLG